MGSCRLRTNCFPDSQGNGLCNRRWEGVTYLTVGCRFATGELPIIGETLDASGHAKRETGHAFEVGHWGGVGEGFSFDTERCPGLPGAGRAEIGSTVFFGSTDESWGDFVCVCCPLDRAFPAVFRHEIGEAFANRGSHDSIAEWHGGMASFQSTSFALSDNVIMSQNLI